MNTDKAIKLARLHAVIEPKGAMNSSARVALEDAVRCQERGELNFAAHRALQSLKYSVGMFHADCKAVQNWVDKGRI